MSFTRHPTLTFDSCVYFMFILLQLNQPSIDNFQERSVQLTLSVNIQ